MLRNSDFQLQGERGGGGGGGSVYRRMIGTILSCRGSTYRRMIGSRCYGPLIGAFAYMRDLRVVVKPTHCLAIFLISAGWKKVKLLEKSNFLPRLVMIPPPPPNKV